MTAPTREQMTQWALDCGLVEQRDVDNCIIDALFDDLWRFAEIDLRRFAELAYAAGQTAEREACAALHDGEDVLAPVGQSAWGEAYQDGWIAGVSAYREAIRARGANESIN